MELRVLRYFLTVGETGSITRAARLLNVTQPTLSRQLMDLEEELHCKLFERRYHRIVLTQEGLLLMRRAAEILSLTTKTESEFRSLGKSLTGEIRIGAGETDAMNDLASVMADIRLHHAGIRFHLYDDSSVRVLEMLDRGLLDFGVIIHPVDTALYESLLLPTPCEWGIIMRQDDPLTAKRALRLEDIRHLPLIGSRSAHDPKSRDLRSYPGWLAKALPKLNIVGTNNLFYNTIFLVEHRMAYGIGIRMRGFLAEGATLCFRPFEPSISSSHGVVWRRDQIFSPASTHFLAQLKARFAPGGEESES